MTNNERKAMEGSTPNPSDLNRLCIAFLAAKGVRL